MMIMYAATLLRYSSRSRARFACLNGIKQHDDKQSSQSAVCTRSGDVCFKQQRSAALLMLRAPASWIFAVGALNLEELGCHPWAASWSVYVL